MSLFTAVVLGTVLFTHFCAIAVLFDQLAKKGEEIEQLKRVVSALDERSANPILDYSKK